MDNLLISTQPSAWHFPSAVFTRFPEFFGSSPAIQAIAGVFLEWPLITLLYSLRSKRS